MASTSTWHQFLGVLAELTQAGYGPLDILVPLVERTSWINVFKLFAQRAPPLGL